MNEVIIKDTNGFSVFKAGSVDHKPNDGAEKKEKKDRKVCSCGRSDSTECFRPRCDFPGGGS